MCNECNFTVIDFTFMATHWIFLFWTHPSLRRINSFPHEDINKIYVRNSSYHWILAKLIRAFIMRRRANALHAEYQPRLDNRGTTCRVPEWNTNKNVNLSDVVSQGERWGERGERNGVVHLPRCTFSFTRRRIQTYRTFDDNSFFLCIIPSK